MSTEILLLTSTAATIAFVHTLLGPDHYVPFIAMARARGWRWTKAVGITLLCGLGHLVGSVLLGLVGIAIGAQIASIEWIESIRGGLAAWMLTGFGLAYMLWGLRQAIRNRPHVHWHRHDGSSHKHVHTHKGTHAHVHDEGRETGRRSIAPWVIFIIFVLGPCEPLIPLLMYPAAQQSMAGVILVTSVFGIVTVLTMTVIVGLATSSLERIKRPRGWARVERFSHALAGLALVVCGLSVSVLGL